jgi:3-oxoacyl-[acyl-carrier protein] reductase
MSGFESKSAFVTGAGSGIGRATAIELARRGAKVAIHFFKNQKGAAETANAMAASAPSPIAVPLIAGDLSTADGAHKAVLEAVKALGRVDILVNNAGDLIERRPLLEITPELWQRVFDANVTSTLFACQAAVPGMIERKSGAIVNMSSLAAWNGGGAAAAPYAAAKGAIVSLTKALAKELAPHGIRLNCVSPGLIGDTGFHARFTARDAFDGIAKAIPLGRAGTPEDVANAIVFLAGDEAGFLTGETIEVNGGAYMR